VPCRLFVRAAFHCYNLISHKCLCGGQCLLVYFFPHDLCQYSFGLLQLSSFLYGCTESLMDADPSTWVY
jgi:hypothetical protein